MTGLSQFFEFTSSNFVDGQARVLFSKLSDGTLTDQAVPSTIADIFGMVSPYDPLAPSGDSPWVDLGATSSPPEYSRDVSLNEWKIQQQLTAVVLKPNEVVRTVKIPAMEFARADILQMFENGGATVSVSAAANASAQTQQPFGQFTDLAQYRLAFAAFMPLEAGVVTEPSGSTRPRLVVQVFHRCSIAAENVSINYEMAQPLHADLSLKLYLEPGQTQNTEAGSYFIEAAGTITT